METTLLTLLCIFLLGGWLIERFVNLPMAHRRWRILFFSNDKTSSSIAPDDKPLFGEPLKPVRKD